MSKSDSDSENESEDEKKKRRARTKRRKEKQKELASLALALALGFTLGHCLACPLPTRAALASFARRSRGPKTVTCNERAGGARSVSEDDLISGEHAENRVCKRRIWRQNRSRLFASCTQPESILRDLRVRRLTAVDSLLGGREFAILKTVAERDNDADEAAATAASSLARAQRAAQICAIQLRFC